MADLSKTELMTHAQDAIEAFASKGILVQVYFKATCPSCGSRGTFDDPNVIYDAMECAACGQEFPFIAGGYLVVAQLRKIKES